MNEKFLLLIVSADMLKCKTIFSKNTFVSFKTLIQMFVNKYLIIFVYLSIIIRIELYMTLSRLFKDKLIMKFIKYFFQNTSDIDKKLNFLYNL